MSRYIDADKLHEKIIDKQVLAIYEDWDFNTVRDIRHTINEMPTADVEPVRHGRWEKTGWQRGISYEYRCSECKHRIWKKKTQKLPNYCEKCGAKMDEENK